MLVSRMRCVIFTEWIILEMSRGRIGRFRGKIFQEKRVCYVNGVLIVKTPQKNCVPEEEESVERNFGMQGEVHSIKGE